SNSHPQSSPAPRHFVLAGLPPTLPPSASHHVLQQQNEVLHQLLETAHVELEKGYTIQKLMEHEN
ncbi:hypothetical protein P691DRAFT_617371, partial [Macrolepiota fuliginosa MF-IS2]